MFAIEVWVLEQGLPPNFCGTIDAAQTRLIAFYQSLGAVVESSGEVQHPQACTYGGQQ